MSIPTCEIPQHTVPSEIEQSHFLPEQLVHTLADISEGDDGRSEDMKLHLPNPLKVILHI